MEYLTLIKPYLYIISFASLAISVAAGFMGDFLGEGFKFGRRRTRPETRLGRWLLGVERANFAICLTSIVMIFAIPLLTS